MKSSEYIYKVTEDGRGESFIVNLETKQCTCMKFQEDELPCRHAVTIISEKRMEITNYCSPYYLNKTLKHTYTPIINPICTADSFGLPEQVAK